MQQPEAEGNKPLFSMETMARQYLEKTLARLQVETGFRLVVTVPQLAKLLGINTTKAYQLTRQEGFPILRLGKRLLCPIPALLGWLEAQAYLPPDQQAAANLGKTRAKR